MSMSEDAIFPSNEGRKLETGKRQTLVWVPWRCSCCQKPLLGFMRLVPGETRLLTRAELQIVGIAICLN
jgi:hypothetical protein